MLIGLHDAEKEHLKNKAFPNYALMKISSYHKALGNVVEWWDKAKQYDIVYSSKIFDFTKENSNLPQNTMKGGTGYNMKSILPPEIEKCYPDYSIYPDCDYSVGFLTRGCPNKCNWCCVPKKEGNIKPYRVWNDIVRADTKKLVLMDNNILALPYGVEQLKYLADSHYFIDLNQGMDIRLITDDVCQILKNINWIRYIRFSCDTKEQLPYFDRLLKLFDKYKISKSRVFIYVLVRKDLQDADDRVQSLHKMCKSFNIYAQAERNSRKGIIPNKLQLEFSNRFIYGRAYKRETWEQYYLRHNLVATGGMLQYDNNK